MNDDADSISARDRRAIAAALAAIMAPVTAILGWLVWANADTMKFIDWIFIAIIPLTATAAVVVHKFASADYWNRFKSGFITDIRNRRLIGEASVFVILMSLIAFSNVETFGEGVPTFLWLLFINAAAAIVALTAFQFGQAWWKNRTSRR
jgi:hypothetical protein